MLYHDMKWLFSVDNIPYKQETQIYKENQVDSVTSQMWILWNFQATNMAK